MRLTKAWLWGVRFADGTYLRLEGDTIGEAVDSVGSTMTEVRRYIPVKYKGNEDKKAESLAAFLLKLKQEGENDNE